MENKIIGGIITIVFTAFLSWIAITLIDIKADVAVLKSQFEGLSENVKIVAEKELLILRNDLENDLNSTLDKFETRIHNFEMAAK
jgi:hypothetical protein